jgi:hypothetical protein
MISSFAQAPQAPAMMDRLNALKDDPELQDMFEDMKTNGAAAFQKCVAACAPWALDMDPELFPAALEGPNEHLKRDTSR